MMRTALLYGGALAVLALLVEWLGLRHALGMQSTEMYITAIAALFMVLGVWAGQKLTPAPRPADFARNAQALASLGISDRECEVLDLLAEGCSNKLIARRLAISPNTVKTHVTRLFEKLEVSSRTQAIVRARSLSILP